ncbi:MAG: RNA recognition motif domain-containing protein [Spirochaetia bacterium]|jgi:RNA recognition motif-containing protein
MASKIYVGNLNFSTTENQLEDLFLQYGDVVSVKIITDRETDRSRGFGFVEMGTSEAAEQAINALNNQEFDGRSLRVNEANDRKPRRDSY